MLCNVVAFFFVVYKREFAIWSQTETFKCFLFNNLKYRVTLIGVSKYNYEYIGPVQKRNLFGALNL